MFPRIFIDLDSRVVSGRIIIELFVDKAPKACEK
jgi:cyclophilin family peptidyl-prolyl cis-trans isomerase